MKTFEKIIAVDNKKPVDNAYIKSRKMEMLRVVLAEGIELRFSPSKHNTVQIAVIKEFSSRFAYGSKLLYVGDTANKDLYTDKVSLKALSIPIAESSRLPDVILYDQQRQWLFLIEAVTSHNPVSPKRMIELENTLKECQIDKIYVSAFPGFKEFNKHAADIAWNTEVWLMDFPEHMIHFNGDRFFGPR